MTDIPDNVSEDCSNDLWLLIDDVKDLRVDVIARTATAGKLLLAAVKWSRLLIDHDLGSLEVSGRDVVRWAVAHKCLPPDVQIVSYNPPGRNAIAAELRSAGYEERADGLFSSIKTKED